MTTPQGQAVLHASCVAVQGKGVLILGPSGAGKSSFALQLMALGADLVADDRTEISVENGLAIARSPAILHGLIEARAVGILRAAALPQTTVSLVVDLGQMELHRLPPRRHVSIAGVQIDLVLGPVSGHLCAAVLCYIRGQRHE